MTIAGRPIGVWIAFAAIALMTLLATSAPAHAAGYGDSVIPLAYPPKSMTVPPPGYRLSAIEAIRIADRQPKVVEQHRRHPTLKAFPSIPTYTVSRGLWQITYSTATKNYAEIYVSGRNGKVLQAWTGWQVDWLMARGGEGQFGGHANSWYVFLPLALLFLAPFFDWRRWRRLLHLDLLVLLGFGVSLAFFNAGRIDWSVPLAYPLLGYLLVRMIHAGRRPARPSRRRLMPHVPMTWLVVGLVLVCGFRIAMNVTDSAVIDVGYASVVGADRITHKQELYVDNDIHGDTYGPINYLAYVPFEQAFPWSGHWDNLPAAHAAAIFFDLLTLLGLFVLGLRLRPGRGGRRLGLGLAWAWATYPFTFMVLMSNSNDTLIAALLVWTLVALTSPAARGGLLALGTAAKFVPGALAPLFAGGVGDRRPRSVLAFCGAFAGVCAVSVLLYLPKGGLHEFWNATLGFQLHRQSPFSIWGQYSLDWLHTLVTLGSVGLACALFFWPRRRDPFQVAALGAAVLLCFQLATTHWFYLYLAWVVPFVFVAMFAPWRTGELPAYRVRDSRELGREPAVEPVPLSAP
jgi:hypothetical protein